MAKITHIVKFTIENSTSLPKYVPASEQVLSLRIGDTIEIEFPETSSVGEYEIIDKEEKWHMDDNCNETYWHNYRVELVRGTLKKI